MPPPALFPPPNGKGEPGKCAGTPPLLLPYGKQEGGPIRPWQGV